MYAERSGPLVGLLILEKGREAEADETIHREAKYRVPHPDPLRPLGDIPMTRGLSANSASPRLAYPERHAQCNP